VTKQEVDSGFLVTAYSTNAIPLNMSANVVLRPEKEFIP
jgi:hypothetical protein